MAPRTRAVDSAYRALNGFGAIESDDRKVGHLATPGPAMDPALEFRS